MKGSVLGIKNEEKKKERRRRKGRNKGIRTRGLSLLARGIKIGRGACVRRIRDSIKIRLKPNRLRNRTTLILRELIFKINRISFPFGDDFIFSPRPADYSM